MGSSIEADFFVTELRKGQTLDQEQWISDNISEFNSF